MYAFSKLGYIVIYSPWDIVVKYMKLIPLFSLTLYLSLSLLPGRPNFPTLTFSLIKISVQTTERPRVSH